MGMRENLTTALIIQTILITGGDLTITIHVTVIVVLLIPATCLSSAGTTIKHGSVKARKYHGKPYAMFPCLNEPKNV